jgi:hypothetical protein
VPTDFSADWYLRGTSRPERWRGERHSLHTKLVEAMCADPGRNDLLHAVADVELEKGERVIVLSRRVEHCRAVDREFVARGVRTGFLVGGKENKGEFEATKRGLADGSVRVGVGTIDALGTGIDLPSVAAGILASPTASNQQLTTQVSGRLCRTAKGKDGARLYYLWDWRVHRGHLANLAKWFPSTRVLTARGWTPAAGASVDDLDLDPGGIRDRLRGGEEEARMKSRKPVEQQAAAQEPVKTTAFISRSGTFPEVVQERATDFFDKPLDSASLAADASQLYQALKAKGFALGASAVRDWGEPQKLSAAMWSLGKLEEVPAHVASGLDDSPRKPARSPLEEDLSALLARINAENKEGFPMDLPTLAGLETAQRATLARWVEHLAPRPEFLARAGIEARVQKLEEKTDPDRVARTVKRDVEASSKVVTREVFNPTTGTFTPTAVLDNSETTYEGPEFTVRWAEERYCLAPGASIVTCTVGGHELRARVGPNETAGQALARANKELAAFAEASRAEKLASHRRTLIEFGILKEEPK